MHSHEGGHHVEYLHRGNNRHLHVYTTKAENSECNRKIDHVQRVPSSRHRQLDMPACTAQLCFCLRNLILSTLKS